MTRREMKGHMNGIREDLKRLSKEVNFINDDEDPELDEDDEADADEEDEMTSTGGSSSSKGLGGGDSLKRIYRESSKKLIAKAGTTADVISKCLDAVRKNDFISVSKSDYEAALHTLTTNYLREHEKTNYYKAYDQVLKTDCGRALYRGYLDCPGDLYNADDYDAPPVGNRVPATYDSDLAHDTLMKISKGQAPTKAEVEKSLDALAMYEIRKNGGDFYQAYSKVLETPAGQKLYNALDILTRYAE